jgi:ribosomal protein L40E
MIEIVLFAMASAALAFTLLPMVRPQARISGGEENVEDLFLAKERIYANIKDLDFDHQVGKIGREDYLAMRQAMKQEAEAVLGRIDQLKAGNLREVLEREIARHRKEPRTGVCLECGANNQLSARFCAQCGHRLG